MWKPLKSLWVTFFVLYHFNREEILHSTVVKFITFTLTVCAPYFVNLNNNTFQLKRYYSLFIYVHSKREQKSHLQLSNLQNACSVLYIYFRLRQCKNYWNQLNLTDLQSNVHFYVIRPKATEFREIKQTTRPLRRSRSFKVTDFGTNRKAHMRLPISD